MYDKKRSGIGKWKRTLTGFACMVSRESGSVTGTGEAGKLQFNDKAGIGQYGTG